MVAVAGIIWWMGLLDLCMDLLAVSSISASGEFFCDLRYVGGTSIIPNRIGGVMVSVLASSAIDRGFEPRSSQTKNYKIGICCFSAKHVALRRKNKDWLAQNQDNVSEWGDMSIRRLLFQ